MEQSRLCFGVASTCSKTPYNASYARISVPNAPEPYFESNRRQVGDSVVHYLYSQPTQRRGVLACSTTTRCSQTPNT
jgi:hypothetical protein